jgi:hypothetical protein
MLRKIGQLDTEAIPQSRTFGFNNYAVNEAYEDPRVETQDIKIPKCFIHTAHLLADSLTLNKIRPDIFSDSVLNFIETNKSKPFFYLLSNGISSRPFSPHLTTLHWANGTLMIAILRIFSSMMASNMDRTGKDR